jgi:flagellar protein FliJ
MARGFRLQPVLELAQRRLDAATGQLQKLGVQRAEAQAKLAQLQTFLAEYRATRARELGRGMQPDRLRDFDAFLPKLERAIAQQSAEVERIAGTWETEHRQWLELRNREQALRVLERRHATQQAARDARSEQKQHDEFAAGKVRPAPDA